jgi:subtilisin family serine protease
MLGGPVATHPEQFQVPDHGLFAAGIVYSIVPPGTSVYLIRVLNDYGIGDSLAIGHALAGLPRALLGTDQPGPRHARLVVNLSLGAEIPIPARLFDRWLPETARTPADMASHLPELCALFDHLHGNLSDVLSWLTERGVLVVAAAGNDALRADVPPGEPPPPRYPARYDDVLGVAAVRRDLRSPALYSNRGDVVLQAGSGHIATFGGNVVPAANDQASAGTVPNDSVLGLFSGAIPPASPNTTGWARWSGTSFSTPIIAGVAARLWGTDRSRTPIGLAQYVRSFGHDLHPGVDPFSPLEVPVLHVTQV